MNDKQSKIAAMNTWRRFFNRILFSLSQVRHSILTGQVDSALAVNLNHLDKQLVTNGYNILDLFYPVIIQLGDMD